MPRGRPKVKKTEEKPMEPKAEKASYNPTRWTDPMASFAPEDDSLEARLWRQSQRQQGKA